LVSNRVLGEGGGVWGGRGWPQAIPSPPRTDELNRAATTACGMKSDAAMAGVIKIESLSFFLHGPAVNSNRVGYLARGLRGHHAPAKARHLTYQATFWTLKKNLD